MNGFNISEAGHIVNLIPPVDGNNGAPVTAQAFSMKGWDHVSIILQLGVTAAAPTSIVLKSAATAGGSGTAFNFNYYAMNPIASGPSNDVLGSKSTTVTASTGIPSPTAIDNVFYVIEIDSAELPDGSPYVQLCVTNPASSVLMSAVAVLSAGRFQGVGSPTVTA